MYEAYFEMEHTPFTRDLPPQSLYEPPFIEDVLGRLGYVADRQLFAVLTADPGWKINGLKKNKKYYVKVRTVVEHDDSFYYSDYTKVKSIKTK